MLREDRTAPRVGFALRRDLPSRALEAKIVKADAGEEGGDAKRGAHVAKDLCSAANVSAGIASTCPVAH